MYFCYFLKTTDFNVGISSVEMVRITITFSVCSMFLYNLEYEKENLLITSMIYNFLCQNDNSLLFATTGTFPRPILLFPIKYNLTNNGTAYFSWEVGEHYYNVTYRMVRFLCVCLIVHMYTNIMYINICICNVISDKHRHFKNACTVVMFVLQINTQVSSNKREW